MSQTHAPAGRRRRVGAPAASAELQLARSHGFRSNQSFEPLPEPTGPAPYRLPLADVVGADAAERIRRSSRIVFHCVGDTGGVKSPQPQQIVAHWLEHDVAAGGGDAPSFLYHLGDVVYFNGQRAEYYPQFYEPYAQYAAPIVGVPGNHDGDPADPARDPSLAAFVENFCAPRPHLTREAEEVPRDAMTQPNVYWTLVAPLLTVVGLYTNVPEGGRVDHDQVEWLAGELAAAPKDAALLVALHHPPYSADAHHGGSSSMGSMLDGAIAASGRVPTAVLSGHVHNYQRFTRERNGRQVPYLVVGSGGYWHLHAVARDAAGRRLPKPWRTPDPEVTLETYADDRHGYLRLTVTAETLAGEYVTVPRPHESWTRGPVEVVDSFTVDLAMNTVR